MIIPNNSFKDDIKDYIIYLEVFLDTKIDALKS